MKKFSLFLILSILIIGLISGFQKVIPKPETKSKLENILNNKITDLNALPVNYQSLNKIPSLFVQFETKGSDVFVECILTGISFREADEPKQKTGKLIVSIDGRKKQEVTSAAFIVRNVPPGDHKVKLEVVNLQNIPYGLSKEFFVNIPK